MKQSAERRGVGQKSPAIEMIGRAIISMMMMMMIVIMIIIIVTIPIIITAPSIFTTRTSAPTGSCLLYLWRLYFHCLCRLLSMCHRPTHWNCLIPFVMNARNRDRAHDYTAVNVLAHSFQLPLFLTTRLPHCVVHFDSSCKLALYLGRSKITLAPLALLDHWPVGCEMAEGKSGIN